MFFLFGTLLNLEVAINGVNLEFVPINCVLLEHWNKYVFPFWRHSARAQLVILEHCMPCVLHG